MGEGRLVFTLKDNIVIVGFIIDDSNGFSDIKKEMIEKSTIIEDTVDVFKFNFRCRDKEYLTSILKDTCLFRVVDTVSFESFEVYFNSTSEDTLTDLGLDYNIKKGCYGFKYYSPRPDAYIMYILHRTADENWVELIYYDIFIFENLKGKISFVTYEIITSTKPYYHGLISIKNLDYVILTFRIESYKDIENILNLEYIYGLGFILEFTVGDGIIWTNIENSSIFHIGTSYKYKLRKSLNLNLYYEHYRLKIYLGSLLNIDSGFCFVGKYCLLVNSDYSDFIVPLQCEYVYCYDLSNLSFKNIIFHSNVKEFIPMYYDLDACKGKTLYLSKLCNFRVLTIHLLYREFDNYISKKTEEVHGKYTYELKEIEIEKFSNEFNTIESAVNELSKHYDFGISIKFY
jgi:hypothetical protein